MTQKSKTYLQPSCSWLNSPHGLQLSYFALEYIKKLKDSGPLLINNKAEKMNEK